MNGLFGQDKLLGMLKARNYRDIEKLFPFIATIFDQALGEIHAAPVTEIFRLVHRDYETCVSLRSSGLLYS